MINLPKLLADSENFGKNGSDLAEGGKFSDGSNR
jgi:hypothetical protein